MVPVSLTSASNAERLLCSCLVRHIIRLVLVNANISLTLQFGCAKAHFTGARFSKIFLMLDFTTEIQSTSHSVNALRSRDFRSLNAKFAECSAL